MKASLLPAHSDTCSSRTERCDDCGQFIMLKYLAPHKESHKLKKIPNGKRNLGSTQCYFYSFKINHFVLKLLSQS